MSVVKLYHDQNTYTQGLIYDSKTDTFYESSGLYGKSYLRQVSKKGDVLRQYNLPDKYFAEGIALVNNYIFQLTWKENIIFIYDVSNFENGPIKMIEWNKEGWGMVYNGKNLIISDGTDTIYFLNSKAPFTLERTIKVRDGVSIMRNINALSWYNGKIYANIYHTNLICIINPINGVVEKKLDITEFVPKTFDREAVANGITFDNVNQKMYITGKFWNVLYEIKLK